MELLKKASLKPVETEVDVTSGNEKDNDNDESSHESESSDGNDSRSNANVLKQMAPPLRWARSICPLASYQVEDVPRCGAPLVSAPMSPAATLCVLAHPKGPATSRTPVSSRSVPPCPPCDAFV